MKGIILCGGTGTRLQPATFTINKHLLNILNRPMVLYPIETLKKMGVTDIMIISGGDHIGGFTEFLGDGSDYNIKITYKVQKTAGGIAQALSLAEDFVDGQFAVILGDNLFGDPIPVPKKCGLVLKYVEDPKRFGVLITDDENQSRTIVEKPKEIKPANIPPMAVTGLYFYTPEIFDFIKTLKPSERGELEITDVNNWCLNNIETEIITYNGFWKDAGTRKSLKECIDWAYENEE
jgi:glucose-1-phosphate thymidylyltransferase